jgi:hypothetical protein
MKAELVAERMVDLAIGPVRMTLARHDDGRYSGVAALAQTGRRIGLLDAGPALDGVIRAERCLVDETIAGPEVKAELQRLLAAMTAGEEMVAGC